MNWLFIVELAGGISTLAAALAVLVGFFTKEKRKLEGQKCLLRSEMVKIYYSNRESGTIRQYELENFLLLYGAYKALKGNSFVDEIQDKVTKFEVIT